MKKINSLLMVGLGIVFALGVFAVQSRAEIVLDEATTPLPQPGASFKFDEKASGCLANGDLRFIIVQDKKSKEPNLAMFGWFKLGFMNGGAPNCYGMIPQMQGTWVLDEGNNYRFEIIHDWSGWSDIITNLESGYAYVCAQLDASYGQWRYLPLGEDTILLEKDRDCAPNQVLSNP